MGLLVARRGILAASAAPAPAPSGDYAAEVLADEPVGYWRFEETSGTVASDEIAWADGTYTASPDLTVPGVTSADVPGDTAAKFRDGSRVVWPYTVGMNQTTFTAEAWFRVDDAASGSSNQQVIIGRDSDSLSRRLWEVRILGGVDVGVVNVLLWQSNGTLHTLAGTTVVVDGEWHHVALVVEPTEFRIYVDGALDGTQALTDPVRESTDTGLSVGASLRGPGALPLRGAVDEPAYYDTALTSVRINAHIDAIAVIPSLTVDSPADLDDLYGWFDATEETYSNNDLVPSWTDRSGNGRHALQATSGSQPTFLTAGLNGFPCIDFAGLKFLDLDAASESLRPVTVLAVVEWDGAGDTVLLAGTTSSGATSIDWHFAKQRLLREGEILIGEALSSLLANTAHVLDVRWDGDGHVFGFDGADDGSGAAGNAPYARVPRIGKRSGTLSTGLDAKVGELIIYNRRLFAAEITEVRAYLANKWGFTI